MALTRLYQGSFTAGELAPAMHARADLNRYQLGLKTALNVIVHAEGGVSNRAGLEFVSEVKNSDTGARLVPFIYSLVQAYVLEMGAAYTRVVRDGGVILHPAKAITAITAANPGVVTIAAHGYSNGDEVLLYGIGGIDRLTGRTFIVSDATTNTFTLTDRGTGAKVNTATLPAYTGGGTSERVYEVTTAYTLAQAKALNYVQDADVMYLTHQETPVRKLARPSELGWTVSNPTFAPQIAAPATPTAVATTGTGTTSYRYKVAAIDDNPSEESLPSAASAPITNNLSVAGNKNTISWTAVSGAARYAVYKEDNGVYGYIGGTDGLSFVDENIAADLSQTPQTARNPFNGAGNYPRTATFFEQRLVLAATANDPQLVEMSQSGGNYENFGRSSPTKPSDSITFRVKARRRNEIMSMVPSRELLLMTSGGEFNVTSGSDSGLTPASVNVRAQGERGSGFLQPLTIGRQVLYYRPRGCVVASFGYQFTDDAYVDNDLTIMSRHLFTNHSIVSWGYAQAPGSIVWAVREDGVVLSLTYMIEHEVWGWTRHETDGFFEDVTVIPEGDEDVPYFIVRRTVGGVTRRFIERMRTRYFGDDVADAFCVDCGVTYEGAPTTLIRGLDHLEGVAVSVLADGNVVAGKIVSGGALTLDVAASKVHIGRGYTARIKTLDIDLGSVQGLGTVQARTKSTPTVKLRVDKTRGLFIGPTEDRMYEFKQRATEPWDAAIAMYTGTIGVGMPDEWNDGSNVVIEQRDPLPMTILAVMPDIVLGS